MCGGEVFIAGAIGPLGELEQFDPGESGPLVAEQARILEGRGVDLILLETFYDLDELVAAVEAVRGVSQLPLVALMTFDADGQTLGGVSAGDAAARLDGLELAAIGANHSAGPAAALNAIAQMQGDGRILAALPNVGLASLAGSRVIFPHATPEYFSEFAAQARRLGAGLIGGCCGTTPAQIAAIRAAVDEDRTPSAPLVVRERELVAAASAPRTEETLLARMLREGEFVVSVQLDPPLGGSNDALLETARVLQESGKAHLVDVNDNPRARARMSGVMASVAIERACGLETIPHLTPRDMTVAGLEVAPPRNPRRGRPQHPRRHGRPARGGRLPGRARRLRGRGDRADAADREPEPRRGQPRPHDRRADVVLHRRRRQPVRRRPRGRARPLRAEARGRAQFAMTQVLFDLRYLDAFLDRFGGRSPIPLLVGVWPLRSHALAVRVHNEVPGMVVPEAVQQRLLDAGEAAAAVGAELARELIAESREKAAGVYLVAPFRQPLGILEIL